MTNRESIARALGVNRNLKSAKEVSADIDRRVLFIKDALREAGMHSLVLGVSGGVDSSVAGLLCQRAASELRSEGYSAQFYAVRLPYGVQQDEDDAQAALDYIDPDKVVTVDIKPSVDALSSVFQILNPMDALQDLVKGNIKARIRMTALYSVSGLHQGLVVGTDHAAETLMGFSTKFGDGACDISPLAGLTKGQVRRIASDLGLPMALVLKTPTADLEDLSPAKADETALGVSYDQIDAFLLGEDLDQVTLGKIERQYQATSHKRSMPKTPL